MSEPSEISARQLIDSRGGVFIVSEALGWPYSTVHTWYLTNKMPSYRRAPIIGLKAQDPPPPKGKIQRAAAQPDQAA